MGEADRNTHTPDGQKRTDKWNTRPPDQSNRAELRQRKSSARCQWGKKTKKKLLQCKVDEGCADNVLCIVCLLLVLGII